MSEKICNICGGNNVIIPMNAMSTKNIYAPAPPIYKYKCLTCNADTNIVVTDKDLEEFNECSEASMFKKRSKLNPKYYTKKLSIKKANSLYKPWDHSRMSSAYPDDLVRLIKLQEIMRKYIPSYKIKIFATHGKIWVADYPFDGMTQEDIDELLESGFFFDVEYGDIAMYA